ncbi:hypothetical protein LTR50_007651 [Elasticomyces elasticus]|nr:hypothetical protein LTR50_007651 [Elasticomyces elasticus]
MRWPGKSRNELYSKVETAVSYNVGGQVSASWGFQCDEEDESVEVNKNFKLFLDPHYKPTFEFAPMRDEAQRWYSDYLRFLYSYIKRTLGESIAQFAFKNIEFVFSVPTTWKDEAMIADVQRLISDAGYGKPDNERFTVTLTEAEAAAVYAAKQQMQRDDVFLVCDSGGGTTDLNVLKVMNASAGRTEIEPLYVNEGEAIGSTLIDHKAQCLLVERLEKIRDELCESSDILAKKMIQNRFIGYKCNFGTRAGRVPKYKFPIPGLEGRHLNFPHAGIEDSMVVLTNDELQRLFDQQVNRILTLIDEQLRVVQSEHPSESVNYLMLSGGLGSSPYLQERVRDRYERGAGAVFPNAQNMAILIAAEPQLAVVQGLVYARVQALKGGPELLSSRRCPVSYGVVVRELWNPREHQGEYIQRDPLDKKRWAENQIFWFVKQNQKVDVKKGVNQSFRCKIPLGRERDPWHTRVVMSRMPARDLPRSLKHEGAKVVCKIETELDPCDLRPKNDKWYHLRREYTLAEFDMKMLVGPGLRFEIWGKQGRKSKAHDEIEVEWQPANDDGPEPAPDMQNEFGMYRT